MSHDPKEALQDARRQLEIAGSPSPARDASALMDKVQGDAPPWTPLSDAQLAELNRYIQRRARREPISHIVGKRAFWMHDFIVTDAVLDPRPETETLVSVASDTSFARVLDLGTGSGCILLSLLYEVPEATGVGVDVSEPALDIARQNAQRVGVEDRVTLLVSDWFDKVEGQFDLIVSNPPYIAEVEMPDLAPELSFEPRLALTDEADGLTAYRAITSGAGRFLKPSGRLLVEIGPTQAVAVSDLFAAHGFTDVTVHPDLDGRDRVVSGVFPPQNATN
ncbi:peptide chain release factor N(5)-glutamine methyltransferase [Marivita hallyeonensis]|uniref:Release factor glutamine methyltransferase n=1 Tax=Marivita hallyeonensis TaxID=996342 RepID=A0A1M5VQP0_9RHOB|nr:peptide chain release factor N(5)-glutamine methyltransferase [Marivita hallyeonensis]SHH77510.1 [protein release factor]-glutamine N5-methyltransferase [Marivita hallyeonensis]